MRSGPVLRWFCSGPDDEDESSDDEEDGEELVLQGQALNVRPLAAPGAVCRRLASWPILERG